MRGSASGGDGPASGLGLGLVDTGRLAGAELRFARSLLHPAELEHARGLRIAKRRVDYVGGRLAARRALAMQRGWRTIEVRAIPEGAAGAGQPVVHGRLGTPHAGALSISHVAGLAAAVARSAGRVGLDLERVETRHSAFVDEAFAPGELEAWQRSLGDASRPAPDGALLVTWAWCAKEAALKLGGLGLRASLTSFRVTPIEVAPLLDPADAPAPAVVALRWVRALTSAGDAWLGGWTDGRLVLAVARD